MDKILMWLHYKPDHPLHHPLRNVVEGVHFTLYKKFNITSYVAKLIVSLRQRVQKRVFRQIQGVIFAVEGLQFPRIANLVLYTQCRFFQQRVYPLLKTLYITLYSTLVPTHFYQGQTPNGIMQNNKMVQQLHHADRRPKITMKKP